MRYLGQSRGKTPSHCQVCRSAHPGQHWCDFHSAWHAAARFTPRPKVKSGVTNICTEAASIKLSESGSYAAITCAACGETKPSHRFRGGRAKAVACKECEDGHPGLRWCPDHAEWLPVSQFVNTGVGSRFQSVRCVSCRTAATHGVTTAFILTRQGSTERECASCGRVDALVIDHDHGHCSGPSGCRECVRGFLCHACNTAEGLLRSPERARSLANYMERTFREW